MSQGNKNHHNTPVATKQTAQQVTKIWITNKADRKAVKLEVTDKDIIRAIGEARAQGNSFRGELAPNVYYDKIAISQRKLGTQHTRYALATKKNNKYFVLGFYAKAKINYLSKVKINEYAEESRKLLDARHGEIQEMIEIGILRKIR